jgi:hypothetical protein
VDPPRWIVRAASIILESEESAKDFTRSRQ